jgi:hypothetical protein
MTLYTVIGTDDEAGAGSSFALQVEAASAGAAELTVDPDCRVVSVLEGAHLLDPEGTFPPESEWTVLAFYSDNDQRYAAGAQAATAAEACELAHLQAIEDNQIEGEDGEEPESPICVVGAVLGSHQCAGLLGRPTTTAESAALVAGTRRCR